MVLGAEKRNKLAELVACRKAALAGAGTSAPVGPSLAAASAQDSLGPAPVDKQKGLVVAIGSEDEDTDTGLVFKRQRVDNVVAPSHFATDGHAPSFGDNSPSASSPCELIAHEGGGRALLKVAKRLLLLSSQAFSNKPLNVSRIEMM